MEGTDWVSRAVCISDTTGSSSASKLSILNQFIHDYCEVCPVAQECLDSSYRTTPEGWSIDDGYWTVRGGYLPTSKRKDPGRPRVSTDQSGPWKPKPAPAEVQPGNNMLQRGVCNNGIHGIESPCDLSEGSCRACRSEHRGFDPSGNKPTRETCRSGNHPWIEENIITGKPDKNGYMAKCCRPCRRQRERERRALDKGCAKIAS